MGGGGTGADADADTTVPSGGEGRGGGGDDGGGLDDGTTPVSRNGAVTLPTLPFTSNVTVSVSATVAPPV